MAGFYVHIPFCSKACYYCDFHFVASLRYKDELLSALKKEIILRKNEWDDCIFNTLYFGGGTPSVLSVDEICELIKVIFDNFKFSEHPEITFEANPDDLSLEYLVGLKSNTPINRFSIGIQSFNNNDLQLMNRRHNREQAIQSIENAYKLGFTNLNVDLIYGIPKSDNNVWLENLKIFRDLQIPHLSAYHLMFEPKTIFTHLLKKNKLKPVSEDKSNKQYLELIRFMLENGYEHYEISNFAKDKLYSKHNTAYWLGKPYIGVGPSAHSFNGTTRQWNISNNSLYVKYLNAKSDEWNEFEVLSENDRYNDYIITALRTMWGINKNYLLDAFGSKALKNFETIAKTFLQRGDMKLIRDNYSLTDKGFFVSDYIMKEFILV